MQLSILCTRQLTKILFIKYMYSSRAPPNLACFLFEPKGDRRRNVYFECIQFNTNISIRSVSGYTRNAVGSSFIG